MLQLLESIAGFRAGLDTRPDAGWQGETMETALSSLPGLRDMLTWLSEHPVVTALLGFALLGLFAFIAHQVTRRVLLRLVTVFVRQSTIWWDDVLLERKVFHRLAMAVPVLVVHQGILLVPHLAPWLTDLAQRLALVALAVVAVRTSSALLAAANQIYERYPMARDQPIKGYLQVISIVVHIMASVFIIATLLNKSPFLLIGGIGAMTAVLLLIFRETLLSLVAGTTLTANNLIRVGDWIEMPQFGADGDVIDIALNTVRVQNWDRTITVIPTHKFLEHSFRNWRGMAEAGGRRIKRSFFIDMRTIRLLDDAEVERLSRFALLKEYLARKREEIEAYNREHCPDPAVVANARHLTNVGTLRAYLLNYLRQHPQVRQDMIVMVRQLQPTPEGLPMEIYVFSADTRWVNYEGIQADIFDHVLAIVPEFGLRVFQQPSGADMAEAFRAGPDRAAAGMLAESEQGDG